jgi:hypothetical protein
MKINKIDVSEAGLCFPLQEPTLLGSLERTVHYLWTTVVDESRQYYLSGAPSAHGRYYTETISIK